MFMSQTEDFFDFDIGTGLPSEAIISTISNASLNIINHVVSNRSLQVFTSSGEFAAAEYDGSPLEPTNNSIRLQSKNGSSDVEPIELDNATFYIRKGGKAVMAFIINENSQVYESLEVSVLSPQLIKNPVSSAVLAGSTEESANFIFIVNDDGTLACYQTLREQDVSAWTGWSTDGSFEEITNVEEDVYLVVERVIEGSNKLYIEQLDRTVYTDSAFTNTYGMPTRTITGLGHLEGKEVQIRGDGFVLTPQTVVNGEIELSEDEPEVSTVEVGLNFTPQLIPNPPVIIASGNNFSYNILRINKAYIHYYESLGIYVNGKEEIPYLEFVDTDQPTVKSGIKELVLLGWDRLPDIEITQKVPLPMTILAVGAEVSK
jgi:hypothetical protein